MLGAFVTIAILLAAVAYTVLIVRRTRREQRARSEERAALLLAAMHGKPGEARTGTAHAAPAASAVPVQASAAAPAPVAGDAPPTLAALKRERFLTGPQRLLYLILRTALPDHVIMANTRMIDLLDLPDGDEAAARDARLRELLHQRLDCLVCRSDLVPVAALMVYAAAMPRAPEEQRQAEALRELGIKFLRFRADSLPRPAEMRALVLG